MQTKTPVKISNKPYPLISQKERLDILEKVRGMWRDRKPDPIKELDRLRKERERKLAL